MNKTEISISKNLASYAVYKELYDSKKDSYDIIVEFIKSSLKIRKLYSFTSRGIVTNLKEDFDFEIPESIIKTALKRLGAKKSEGTYTISDNLNNENLIVDDKQEEITENNEHIITNLYLYIEEKNNKKLTQNDKNDISQSFSSFLLNENGIEHKFYEDISSYIMLNQKNLDFKKQLNIIREGVILYSGVRYGEITQKRRELVNDLVIYLDTEILFHLAGYNGELYKSLFEDFYKLVKEINSSKRKIFFRYFKTTKDEINGYFKKAESLLDKPTKIDPSKTAMNSIIDGCSTGSDIIAKKTSFFKLLETYTIVIDPKENYLTDETHEYNLINQSLLQDLKENSNYGEYEINNSLNKLNSINILRAKKYNNNFYNIGYILLSGNSRIFKIAWNQYLKTEGEVPLVTHLDFLINKFWLKLNKGLGNTNLPKIFDVITKAQIVLSNNINSNVSNKYSELQEQVHKGHIGKEEIIDTIINLKSEVKQPEEISEDTLSDILNTLSIKDIEKYKYEKDKFKNKAIQDEEENIKLKSDIDSIKKLTVQQKKALLQSKTTELKALKKLQNVADSNSSKHIKKYKYVWSGLLIVYYIVFFVFINKLGWNTMEQWVWIIGAAFPIAISWLYTIINEKKFDILHHLSNKRKYYTQKEYEKLELDIGKLSQLEKDIQDIQQNLEQKR